MRDLLLPLPQSPEYARACKAMGLELRLCKRETGGDINLLWQVQSRKLPVLGRVDMVSRGPVGREPADVARWLERWDRWHDGRPMLLNADGMQASALKRAGFFPLMTPATLAMLDLGEHNEMRAGLHQKWRNRLNRAEALRVKVTRHALSDGHWVLHRELEQAKTKGYRGLPPAFSACYARANPGQAVVFEARHNKELVAAAVVLRHGRMATWQIGHSTDQGRKVNAMNAVLWQMMGWLADQGHDTLDLGIINSDDAAGLARFKLGTGARAHRLAGTWLHYGALAPIARCLPTSLVA
ncbi:MAG: GNAT family N-acetyltransferase [Pelagimonas sp.]